MITFIIATHNRAWCLSECLESFLDQDNQDDDWRVVVVDNNSSDGTADVVRNYADRSRRIGYLAEPKQGVSEARNAGLRQASTPYVAFVDDECCMAPSYVDRARRIIAEERPLCFGGPIGARFRRDPPRPRWYKDEYGAYSSPENNRPDALPSLSAGNIFFDRQVLLAIGGFDPTLGPVGEKMRYGEENAAIALIAEQYGSDRIVYDPELVNFHLVRPEKFTWRWIIRENFQRGWARGLLASSGRGDFDLGGSARVRDQLLDLIQDLTLARLILEKSQYPYWQNLIYERWMGYVRAAGMISAKACERLRRHGR